jgi:hypothetical protein
MVCGCLCKTSRSRARRRSRGRRSKPNATNRELCEPLLSLGDDQDLDVQVRTSTGPAQAFRQKASMGSATTTTTTTTMSSDLSSPDAAIDLGRGIDFGSFSLHDHDHNDSPNSPLQLHYHHNPNHNQNKYQDVPDDELEDLQKLEKHFPLATHAERMRFLNAKGGNYNLAHEQLKNYLEWRETYDLDQLASIPNGLSSPTLSSDDSFHSCASSDGTLDQIDWKFASDKALTCNDNSCFESTPAMLPQLVRILTVPGSDEHLCDREGNRILHLLPAQMDPRVASAETFQLCVAFYLERKLSRESMEKLTVVVDVRGGYGWANPKPNKLVPFIKMVTGCMEKNFPERLSKLVLFPMPRAAAVLWGVIKRFLDPNTASKIAVIPGNAGNDAPPPYKKMEVHMERDIIELMEAIRVDTFT